MDGPLYLTVASAAIYISIRVRGISATDIRLCYHVSILLQMNRLVDRQSLNLLIEGKLPVGLHPASTVV